MNTYISILRGINVSGQKKILMNDLKALYEKLNFLDATTYIQSGNVVFNTKEDITEQYISESLEQAILLKYGFNVPVIVRAIEDMERISLVNPYLSEENIDVEKLHVTFLSEFPSQKAVDKILLNSYYQERFTIIGKEIFLHCPNGYGTTKLTNNFFEKNLQTTATTRNWRTTIQLLGIAKDLGR